MASKVLVSVALASVALASPVTFNEGFAGDAIFAHTHRLFSRQDAGTCRNQSCEVATVSGSTGLTVYPYMTYPTGDTQDGDCCIIRYFPAAKEAIYENRPGLQSYCASHGGDAPADSNPPGVTSVSVEYPPPTATSTTSSGLFGGLFGRQIALPTLSSSASATPSCKPNTLIYAKGTFETGEFGNTLGPTLQQDLDSNVWNVIGVEYDNSLDNDYCLGLPGGVTARGVLNDQFTACPNSKFAMAGYSQGAMVVRHAIARAPAEQVAAIKSVLTYGDPFCGAQIGQYSGPIHVFCADGDGVCNGQLDITLQHLSYSGDVSAGAALLNADLGS